MTPPATSVFALPDRLAAKADPALIAADEAHLAAVAACLAATVTDLTDRLAATRRSAGRAGTGALERDQEVHRLTGRLHALRRHGVDLCLGHMVPADGTAAVYVGRLGLTDADGRRLLVDWRSPAAAPFAGATHADPMGLARRRRYRWTDGRVTDYWDEVYGDDVVPEAALDDRSAFIAGLGASRSPRMRDVLGTIAADQDAVIRASSTGTLVVDGGPGTGKTVVALHRAAYLLYADRRLRDHRGGVLVVGPHRPYLDYVADVLPSLGEDGVRTCTLPDMVDEGRTAADEADPAVADLKASARWVDAVERAVAFHEDPPTASTVLDVDGVDVRVTRADWAEAFTAPGPGVPHNEARDPIVDELHAILLDRHPDLDDDALGAALDRDARPTLHRAWPLLTAPDVVGDLWSVPAYLRHCASWLSPSDARTLQRSDPHAWTVADLPLLDLVRRRLGDAGAGSRSRRNRATLAADREVMDRVVADLVAADDSELQVMAMLRRADAEHDLVDASRLEAADVDRLAGPFAHVVVDEAQELTDLQWQLLLQRCPSRSLTVVGDRAQARAGFAETWEDRLQRVGLADVRRASLTVNYRTPAEVMAVAEPVIRAALPDANVPRSIRESGVPVRYGAEADLGPVLADWLATHPAGTACVIGAADPTGDDRVRSLTPVLAKGLEFDLVVLVHPAAFGDGLAGAVDRYVAMTRTTGQLVVLT